MWTHNFNVPEARMWVHNSRFQSKYVCPYFKVTKAGCGPIIQGSRSKNVISQFKVPEARMWAHNSRFKKQGCGPIIQGSRSKNVGPEFKVREASM
jgi:hypothetical protein